MSFTLKIYFVDLMAFVPNRTPDAEKKRRMTVLLPKFSGHKPWLCYYKYNCKKKEFVCEDILDKELTISLNSTSLNYITRPSSPRVPNRLTSKKSNYHLSWMKKSTALWPGSKLKDNLLDGNPSDLLGARVQIFKGHLKVAHFCEKRSSDDLANPGKIFRYIFKDDKGNPNKDATGVLTNMNVLEINVPGTFIDISLSSLSGITKNFNSIRICQIDEEEEVNCLIYNGNFEKPIGGITDINHFINLLTNTKKNDHYKIEIESTAADSYTYAKYINLAFTGILGKALEKTKITQTEDSTIMTSVLYNRESCPQILISNG